MPIAAVAFANRTEEEIVGIWTRAADLENLQKIKELTMNVANNSDGCLDVYDIALLHEQLFRFGAYCFYDGLGKQFLLVESGNAFVQIYTGLGQSVDEMAQ